MESERQLRKFGRWVLGPDGKFNPISEGEAAQLARHKPLALEERTAGSECARTLGRTATPRAFPAADLADTAVEMLRGVARWARARVHLAPARLAMRPGAAV